MDIDKIVTEGVKFKRGKDESSPASKPYKFKQKGVTISGSAKMKAAYKTRKAARNSSKK